MSEEQAKLLHSVEGVRKLSQSCQSDSAF